MNHYMTRYMDEQMNEVYVSWIQINFFKWSYQFSKRYYVNGKRQTKMP